jgi:2-hydroxycyclohexanecarboxyl-CoA dehydrogenase
MGTEQLEGKAVVVFGGGRGIGRGCALATAARGAAVVVADINGENAQSVAAEITERGGTGVGAGIRCDVTNEQEVQAAIDIALSRFGGLNGIVNLAYAGTTGGPLEKLNPDGLRRELEVSVLGMFSTMMLALPHMKTNGGSIVNFSSGAAIEGTPGLGGYAAAKAAVRSLGLAAANEWGVHQVRVNTVCPLAMSPAVPEYYKRQPEGAWEASVAKVPLRRYGDPETDIGGAVAFLISDDARFVTGQTIMLDGGQSHV